MIPGAEMPFQVVVAFFFLIILVILVLAGFTPTKPDNEDTDGGRFSFGGFAESNGRSVLLDVNGDRDGSEANSLISIGQGLDQSGESTTRGDSDISVTAASVDQSKVDGTGASRIPCPDCETLNPRTRSYCRNCGNPLKNESRTTIPSTDELPINRRQGPLSNRVDEELHNQIEEDGDDTGTVERADEDIF